MKEDLKVNGDVSIWSYWQLKEMVVVARYNLLKAKNENDKIWWCKRVDKLEKEIELRERVR